MGEAISSEGIWIKIYVVVIFCLFLNQIYPCVSTERYSLFALLILIYGAEYWLENQSLRYKSAGNGKGDAPVIFQRYRSKQRHKTNRLLYIIFRLLISKSNHLQLDRVYRLNCIYIHSIQYIHSISIYRQLLKYKLFSCTNKNWLIVLHIDWYWYSRLKFCLLIQSLYSVQLLAV